MEDPPEYALEPETLFQPRRSIQDVRSIILGNARMLRPWSRDEQVEVVVAKFTPRRPELVPGGRTYMTTNSRVAIRITDHASSDGEGSGHTTPAVPQAAIEQMKHCAHLVMRKTGDLQLHMIVEGRGKPTIEGALDWLLEKTETLAAGVITAHGKDSLPNCCVACRRGFSAT